VFIYLSISVYLYLSFYIYIIYYILGGGAGVYNTYLQLYLYLYYICIYIYIEREGECQRRAVRACTHASALRRGRGAGMYIPIHI